MDLFFYRLFLMLYKAGISIASVGNPKATLWINGRKNQQPIQLQPAKTVWMHCASLGEFEQGRPVLEGIKRQFPTYKIVLSFFSPSGYEVRKNYKGADEVLYLPMDGKKQAEKFITAINPALVIWVKYDYWFYFLTALKEKNIPVILVSGIYRESQPFFKWYGGMWRKMLQCFYYFFVQTAQSKALLLQLGIEKNVMVSGDTRFDRVIEIAESFTSISAQLDDFCRGSKVIVAGSTWDDDEAEIIHYAKAHPEIKFIIAPHEIDKENITDILKEFKDAILYSELEHTKNADSNSHVLIIDNIGMLSKLYHYADITYVGGGFNDSGIHNILEAAVYGKPVIFGPEYGRAEEAKQLIDIGAAFSIENALALEKIFDALFADENLLKNCSALAKQYVYQQQGATSKIIDFIQEKRLLTN
ncbi:MAG: 3-deoxy-D-manno-octulosonic acid transferase [Bacteroidetes bacterium]|nr:3-deoxy-D-manno-octulosonic acid transferase [Bacteroidota bacterium]